MTTLTFPPSTSTGMLRAWLMVAAGTVLVALALGAIVVPTMTRLELSHLQGMQELYVLHALMVLLGIGAIIAPLDAVTLLGLPCKPALIIDVLSTRAAFSQDLILFVARHLAMLGGWREA